MTNKYHIGHDPASFGNIYCGDQLVMSNNGGGISHALVQMVDAANRAGERPDIGKAISEQPVSVSLTACVSRIKLRAKEYKMDLCGMEKYLVKEVLDAAGVKYVF
jgi:hypothetical protein